MAFSLAAVAVLPVQAQADVLVSNLLQPIHTSGTTSIGISTLFPQRILQQHSAAQTFTTGDAADGYTLSSVELYVKTSPDTDALRVSIYNADGDGNPGTSIQVLGSPTTISETSLNTFTPPRRYVSFERDDVFRRGGSDVRYFSPWSFHRPWYCPWSGH